MSKQEEAPNPADEVLVEIPGKPELVDVTPKVEAPKVEKNFEEDLKKMHKRMEYQARQTEQAQKRYEQGMEELRNLVSKIQPTVQKPEPQAEDEVDVVAQTDWKRGVKMVVTPEIEKTVKAILEEERKKDQNERQIQSIQAIREKAMATVLEAHPEIEDEDSEFTITYARVLSEDPSLQSNPLGPELAMARAERRLKSSEKSSDRIRTEGNVETDTQRVARVRSAYIPQGQRPSAEGRIILTAEEKKICDEKGIKYADYTKMRSLNPSDFKDGVSVDE